MLKQLLPFTLIASIALPFLTKADEVAVTNAEQPKPTAQGLSKEQTNFMTLVATAVYIERYKQQECTEIITSFLNAVRKSLQNNKETKNFLSLIFSSQRLDINLMKQLQEKHLDEATHLFLERNKENGKRLIAIGIALAAPAMPGKRVQ